MRRGIHPAQHSSESMHRTQFGVCQRQATHQARECHIFPRRLVVGFCENLPKRPAGPPQSFRTKGIGERIGKTRNKRLQNLRQRIHASARGHRGWHRMGKKWIDQGNIRQHAVIAQAHFDAMLWRIDDGIFGHLGTGASRGWQGDEGQWRTTQFLPLPMTSRKSSASPSLGINAAVACRYRSRCRHRC